MFPMIMDIHTYSAGISITRSALRRIRAAKDMTAMPHSLTNYLKHSAHGIIRSAA